MVSEYRCIFKIVYKCPNSNGNVKDVKYSTGFPDCKSVFLLRYCRYACKVHRRKSFVWFNKSVIFLATDILTFIDTKVSDDRKLH